MDAPGPSASSCRRRSTEAVPLSTSIGGRSSITRRPLVARNPSPAAICRAALDNRERCVRVGEPIVDADGPSLVLHENALRSRRRFRDTPSTAAASASPNRADVLARPRGLVPAPRPRSRDCRSSTNREHGESDVASAAARPDTATTMVSGNAASSLTTRRVSSGTTACDGRGAIGASVPSMSSSAANGRPDSRSTMAGVSGGGGAETFIE